MDDRTVDWIKKVTVFNRIPYCSESERHLYGLTGVCVTYPTLRRISGHLAVSRVSPAVAIS
jgi:hypothetical protein